MYPEVEKLKEELERFNKETAERVRKIIDEYREYLEYCEYCTEEEMCFRHKVPLMILIRGGSVHIKAPPEAMVEGKKEEYIYYTVYVSINYLYHLRANKDKTVIRRKRFNNHYPTAYKEGLETLFESFFISLREPKILRIRYDKNPQETNLNLERDQSE